MSYAIIIISNTSIANGNRNPITGFCPFHLEGGFFSSNLVLMKVNSTRVLHVINLN